jgi:hypothetical protein
MPTAFQGVLFVSLWAEIAVSLGMNAELAEIESLVAVVAVLGLDQWAEGQEGEESREDHTEPIGLSRPRGRRLRSRQHMCVCK